MFDGKGGYQEAENWLRDVKSMAGRQFWSESIFMETVRQHLQGSALKWYRYYQTEINTWNDFEARFKRNYSDKRIMTERFQEMSARVQEVGECAADYFYDKMRMCKKLNLPFSECKQLVISGLRSGVSRELYFRFDIWMSTNCWKILKTMRN